MAVLYKLIWGEVYLIISFLLLNFYFFFTMNTYDGTLTNAFQSTILQKLFALIETDVTLHLCDHSVIFSIVIRWIVFNSRYNYFKLYVRLGKRNISKSIIFKSWFIKCIIDYFRTLTPSWEELLIFNEDLEYVTNFETKTIIFFEIMDFINISIASRQYERLGKKLFIFHITGVCYRYHYFFECMFKTISF